MDKVIGYQKARALMKELDWKLVCCVGVGKPFMYVYHPNQNHQYTVRWDSGEKLLKECRVCSSNQSRHRKVYCYDWEYSNDENI